MKALVSDTWWELLDPTPGEREALIDVRAWAALCPVDGMHFVPRRDWRLLLRYALEVGPARVAAKVRSRRAERGRNAVHVAAGVGLVRRAPAGSALKAGDAVAFLAPAHPLAADRVSLHEGLVRPLPARFDDLARGQRLRFWSADAARRVPAWEALAGFSPWSGAPLDEALVDEAMDAALAALPAAGAAAWREAPLADEAVVTRRAAVAPARAGTRRAVIFGLGHYAKTNLIPNLPAGIRVAEVREIDPLQVGPLADAPADRAVSTAPALGPDDRFDVVCAAGYHHSHARVAAAALRSGARVLVEKPLATTRADLADLLDAASAHPGALFACFHKRFDPLNDLALQDLGVTRAEAVHYQAIVFEVPLPKRHWYRWPASGSRIISNGCHWIDHFLCLNDWSAPVSWDARRAASGDITCMAELQNGASFTLVLTDHGSARLGVRDHVELRARGTTVTIDDGSVYRSESPSRVLRRRRLSRADTYARMYRAIGDRVLAGTPGDSRESIERSTGLVLDLETALDARRGR